MDNLHISLWFMALEMMLLKIMRFQYIWTMSLDSWKTKYFWNNRTNKIPWLIMEECLNQSLFFLLHLFRAQNHQLIYFDILLRDFLTKFIGESLRKIYTYLFPYILYIFWSPDPNLKFMNLFKSSSPGLKSKYSKVLIIKSITNLSLNLNQKKLFKPVTFN